MEIMLWTLVIALTVLIIFSYLLAGIREKKRGVEILYYNKRCIGTKINLCVVGLDNTFLTILELA